MKKFLRGDIEKGAYKDVTVSFIPGRLPELILFDEEDKEVERMFIDKLKYEELHTLIQSKGFQRKEPATAEGDTDYHVQEL